MRKLLFVAMSSLAIAACGGGGDDGGGGPDAGPVVDPCQINSENEATPGFPFDYAAFKSSIYPALESGCSGDACHSGPNGQGGYSVWASTDSECPDVKSFNSFYENSDFRANPATSKVITAIDKTLDTHPLKYEQENATLVLLLDFIQAAFDAANPGGGGGGIANNFDQQKYETSIDPIMHSTGCTVAGCHNLAEGTLGGNFGLNPSPQAGSPEMEENFKLVANLVQLGDITTATEAKFYVFATNSHRGPAFGAQDRTTLSDWIQEALNNLNGDGDVIGCADPNQFNAAVFQEELMPLLLGDVDYNDRDGGRTTTGCIRGPCHGTDRGPSTFYIDEIAPPEQNLARFSCFVDLLNPTNSQVLLCPLNLSGCVKSREHPGGDVFFGVDDLNYQRMLSYVYATKQGSSPLDFAFYVRRIDTIFNDKDAVQDGELNLTCASSACHGIAAAGQPPNNGSNFGVIPEARDEVDLLENFSQAANFAFPPDATQSSLFLYPTNEIANEDNPLATGVDHPGGKDFDVNDQEALDILKWTGGIFPNADGFLQDFLVAGDFAANEINDQPIPFEEELEPRIFQRSGGPNQFNDGEWDGFFSNDVFVDLNQVFNRVDIFDRTAYAVAYVVNATPNELEAIIRVDSPNDIEVFVGVGDSGQLGLNGAGVVRTVNLESYEQTKEPVRIMVKVFQAADDAQFGFQMQFTDENNNPLNNVNKNLVFTLSSDKFGI